MKTKRGREIDPEKRYRRCDPGHPGPFYCKDRVTGQIAFLFDAGGSRHRNPTRSVAASMLWTYIEYKRWLRKDKKKEAGRNALPI